MTMRTLTTSVAALAGAVLASTPGLATGTTGSLTASSTVTLAAGVNGVALSPGQVIYTKHNARNESTVVRRFLAASPGSVSAGPEHLLMPNTYVLSVGASSGRLYYANKHRTYTGQVKQLPAFTGPPWTASGNRALSVGRTGSPPSRWQTSFDARTNQPFAIPEHARDLSGSFIPYDDASGRIWLRNVSTGTSELVRGPAVRVGSIANHGRRWVAWTTGCPSATPCLQTVVIVDRFAGKVWTVRTRGTRTLDLSGGYLAIDAVPGAQSTRQLRAIRLGTTVPFTVGSLPEHLGDSTSPDLIGESTPHFDLEDEQIAWIDRGHVGRLKALGSFVDAPFYLGNLIAPASFSPNGDGRGDVWAMALPVSKALPTCTVTISRGSSVVRTLNCANGNGMATAAWNGRTASGAVLPVGRYSIRVSGRDGDGWLRHYDQQLKPVTFWVDKTA
jgi:hypothetical protein